MKGSMTMEGLAEQLASRDSFHHPMTSGRARVLVKAAECDVSKCLFLGMLELKINFSPCHKVH